MTQWEAAQLINAELDKHGLREQGWSFEFNNRKRSNGLCNYRNKTIQLSRHFLNREDEEVLNTIRHEIAHALAQGDGHGYRWQRACLVTGARPERCASIPNELKPKGKWLARCPSCDRTTYYYRKLRRARACGQCCLRFNGGRFSEQFALIIHETN